MRATRLLAALLSGLATFATWAASDRVVGPDGSVHRVESDAIASGPKESGSVLRHVRQLPSGATETAVVPGTEDAAEDARPAIAVDPESGAVILAWSRGSAEGYGVSVARWSEGSWSAPEAIAPSGTDGVEPRIRVGRGLAHLLWLRRDATGAFAERVAIDRTTLEVRFGPETLATDGASCIPASGDDGSSVEPPEDDLYFAEALSGLEPGDPGRVIVWGTRDEPVPFEFIQGFTLRDDARGKLDVEAERVFGRFVVWVGSDAKLFYTWRRDGRWSEMRVVDTGPGFSAAEAKRAIADAIRLEGPVRP